jgi:RNA polymerase sigma factor (sigma-70 family)
MPFEELVQRINPTLKKITKKLNGHFTFFNDEDLYQEALVNLWVRYNEGVLHDKTDSYILQGCYYYLRNHLRKVHEDADILSLDNPINEDGLKLEDILCSKDQSPFDDLESSMDIEGAADKCLTERERQILIYLLEGMSMREIGIKFSISHVMVLKIRNRIREKYTGHGNWHRN